MPPVIVSPATKVPLTLEQTTTPCNTFPDEEYDVIFVAVVPSLSNPFEPLNISASEIREEDDLNWQLFLALARFEGAQASLGRRQRGGVQTDWRCF